MRTRRSSRSLPGGQLRISFALTKDEKIMLSSDAIALISAAVGAFLGSGLAFLLEENRRRRADRDTRYSSLIQTQLALGMQINTLVIMGRRQIQNLIPYYSAKGINQIFSSPSKRAVESAEILSSGLGVEFRTDDCLLEVDVGILEGESEQDHELLAQFDAVMDNW